MVASLVSRLLMKASPLNTPLVDENSTFVCGADEDEEVKDANEGLFMVEDVEEVDLGADPIPKAFASPLLIHSPTCASMSVTANRLLQIGHLTSSWTNHSWWLRS